MLNFLLRALGDVTECSLEEAAAWLQHRASVGGWRVDVRIVRIDR